MTWFKPAKSASRSSLRDVVDDLVAVRQEFGDEPGSDVACGTVTRIRIDFTVARYPTPTQRNRRVSRTRCGAGRSDRRYTSALWRLFAISASLSSRRTAPGTPVTSDRGGMTTPCGTSAPAPIKERRRHVRAVEDDGADSDEYVVLDLAAGCSTALWPTLTPAPTVTRNSESTWTVTPVLGVGAEADLDGFGLGAQRRAAYQTLALRRG